jgi:glycosyltransferase involved in cell wall biosynthesis
MPPRVFGFHDNSACGYYRITLPLDALTHYAGWDVQTAVGWDERARDYQVIVGQRVGKTDALPIWRRLVAGHRLVYEIDDDFWTIDPTNLRAKIDATPVRMDAIEQAIGVSHMVVTTTEPLAEVLRTHNPNVRVVPNLIDGRLLDVERPRRDNLVVGWAGGDSHLRDWRELADHLIRFLKRHPDAEFHCIGSDFAKVYKIPARVTGWQDIWPYYRSIDFDIGLAPLADIPFNRSKSPIKALEYAALGIPVIASAVGPYAEYVLDGVTGFLVRREHEWGRYLHLLATDHQLRADMGGKAKEHAAEWTIQNGWERWAAVYEEVAG